ATIVIVENCAAELSTRRVGAAEKREIIIRSISTVAKPLMFSLLIILASFLPVFFLEDREARLFDPLAYSKTFAMAFSTLLTLFLLPIIVVWIFDRKTPQPRAGVQTLLSYRFALAAAVVGLLIAAGWLFRGVAQEFLPEITELTIVLIPILIVWLFRRQNAG